MTNNTVCEEGVLGHGDKRYRGTMESYFGKGTELESSTLQQSTMF